MKKLAALLIALCMVFALAVPACAAGDKTLKVWVADAVVDFTKAQIETFMAAHPELKPVLTSSASPRTSFPVSSLLTLSLS